MAENIVIGAGAGIAGLLLGLILGGTDEDAIVDAVGAKVESGVEASASAGSEQLDAMGEQIAGLKSALAGITESQTESSAAMNTKLDEAVAALTSRIDAVSSDVGAVVEATGASQTTQIEATLSGGFQTLQESVSDIATLAATAAASGATDAVAEETTAEAAAPAEPEIEGARAGSTESLLDGKARIFVSGVDEAAQTVRVAINGLSLQTLGQYSELSFSAEGASCSLKLDGIEQGHAQMSAQCAE